MSRAFRLNETGGRERKHSKLQWKIDLGGVGVGGGWGGGCGWGKRNYSIHQFANQSITQSIDQLNKQLINESKN